MDDDVADDHGSNQEQVEDGKRDGVSGVDAVLRMEIEETPRARILKSVLTEAKKRKRRKEYGHQPQRQQRQSAITKSRLVQQNPNQTRKGTLSITTNK